MVISDAVGAVRCVTPSREQDRGLMRPPALIGGIRMRLGRVKVLLEWDSSSERSSNLGAVRSRGGKLWHRLAVKPNSFKYRAFV